MKEQYSYYQKKYKIRSAFLQDPIAPRSCRNF